MRLSLLIILSFSVAMFSCHQEKISKNALIQFVQDPDNGLTQTIKRNGIEIKLTYKPIDLVALQNFASDAIINDSLFESTKHQFSNYLYFILSISKNGQDFLAADPNLSSNLNTLAFNMEEYVSMINGEGDTVSLTDFQTPRFFGVSTSSQTLLVFEKPENFNKIIAIHLKSIGTAITSTYFEFNKQDLESVPQLDLKNI